jgi:hypothetical protein
MKNRSLLFAVFILLISITAISAQDTTKPAADTAKPADTAKTTDFSGKWVLDVSKSKLDPRARIESMTLTVTQNEKELRTYSDVKRTPPPNDMTPGGGRGGMGGGLAGSGPESRTFSLEGKETSVDTVSGGIPTPPMKLKAEMKKDGTLYLSIVRKFSGQMGEVELTTKETWSLSADGKTLTIDREMNSPRGSNTSKLVLARN